MVTNKLGMALARRPEKEIIMTIEKEKVVVIHYTLKDKLGEVIDTSSGSDPLAYIHGLGNIVEGLESALEGKTAGDKIDVVVPPEKGYGKKQEELIQTVSKSKFDDPESVKPGVQFELNGPQGAHQAIILSVEKDEVTFDMNHPLSDQELHFSVEIVEVRDATTEELDHGHVHGLGGHHH
ncbi:MAG: FKBP-type peptidyl-prolyl cis-trans isomerase SlyD [Candidatus Marinamargulisbacteria bacterium]|jgi:FKBP-type peptidyl-prolyl cis-trans isomerase SlyD